MSEIQLHRQRLDDVVNAEHTYPHERFQGRGIVICAGGIRYFTNAYVCASMLRRHGCQLPIQFWHLGEKEMTPEMVEIVRPLGIETVDAKKIQSQYPVRTLNGWELKPYAIIHSPFQEVLYLDADNIAVRNPEFLFESPAYREHGTLFWPDYGRLGRDRAIWDICGIEYRDEPEVESGQIVVDKARCWKALQVAMHMNEWSDFYYHHIHGDKETFHLAWRKINQRYAMPKHGIRSLDGCVMVQHDFEGQPLFQHRNLRKWNLNGENLPVKGFADEMECLACLAELRAQWSAAFRAPCTIEERAVAQRITQQARYVYVRVGYDFRAMEFRSGGSIGEGSAKMEESWNVATVQDRAVLRLVSNSSITCELQEDAHGIFRGNWLCYEKMPIILIPIAKRQHMPDSA